MLVEITVPLDDKVAERARAAAAARGVTVEAFPTELVRLHLQPDIAVIKGDVSSIIGLVKEGQPSDIANDKDKLIGEAAWQEHLEETKQK